MKNAWSFGFLSLSPLIFLSVETVLQLSLHRLSAKPEFRLQQQQRMVLLAQLSQAQKVFQPSRKLTSLGPFSESSMDLAFTSSRSSTKKLLQTPPKVVKVSHARIFWGSLDFINDPLKPTNSAKLVEQKLTKHPFMGWRSTFS